MPCGSLTDIEVYKEMTEKDIIKALSTVQEPDLKEDLITLNMVKDIKIEGNKRIGSHFELNLE